MAYKIVISNKLSNKLAAMFAFFEHNLSLETTRGLVESIDSKMRMACQFPGIGVASAKIAGVYKIRVSKKNKLYYRIRGRKIIMLDLLDTGLRDEI